MATARSGAPSPSVATRSSTTARDTTCWTHQGRRSRTGRRADLQLRGQGNADDHWPAGNGGAEGVLARTRDHERVLAARRHGDWPRCDNKRSGPVFAPDEAAKYLAVLPDRQKIRDGSWPRRQGQL